MGIILGILLWILKITGWILLSVLVLLILIFPVLGGLLYLIVNLQSSTKKFNEKVAVTEAKAKKCYSENSLISAVKEIPQASTQINYLQNFAGFPVFDKSSAEFLPSGERKLESLVNELEKAEKAPTTGEITGDENHAI